MHEKVVLIFLILLSGLLVLFARAAVVGAGTMGGGIAMAYANAGIPVLLKDVDQAALDRHGAKGQDGGHPHQAEHRVTQQIHGRGHLFNTTCIQ